MKSLIIIAVASVFLAACSHAAKTPDQTDSARAAKASSSLSESDIITKYSLAELNGAATLLKVVADQGAKALTDDKGSELIGCELAAKDARTSLVRLQSVISRSVLSEAAVYSQNPKTYSTDHSFETCASNCACGLFNDVIERASTSSFPAGGAKIHSRNQQRLAAKATRLQPSETIACAHKQNWYCGSELKSYLER